jgi:bisphosphoglycerate-independent phosphoglycerate mutase (AlkP superfamily)
LEIKIIDTQLVAIEYIDDEIRHLDEICDFKRKKHARLVIDSEEGRGDDSQEAHGDDPGQGHGDNSEDVPLILGDIELQKGMSHESSKHKIESR